jgi:hypothetical protein
VQLSTLVCILVLLFPVISATDDLYAAQFAFETAVTQKSSKAALSARSFFPRGDHHSPAAAFTPTFSRATDVCVGLIAAKNSLPVCASSISLPPQDRAPPSCPCFL